MSFNWFNRQQTSPAPDASSESTEPTSTQAETTEAAKAGVAPETSGSTPETVDSDYLTWAKAAYKNIQKRQAETASESASGPAASPIADEVVQDSGGAIDAALDAAPTEIEPSESVLAEASLVETKLAEANGVEADVIKADVIERPGILSVSGTSVLADPSSDSVVGEEVSEGAAAETQSRTVSQPAPQIESQISQTTESQTVLPFWAKAEAERQERLERLKAEAISERYPQGVAQEAPEATQDTAPIPELPLDESFVWSAQVLAAQGRRADQVDIEEITWLKRLRQGLDKTRRSLINQLRSIVGQGPLNQDAVLEIESLLLQADVGVAATDYIIEALQQRLRQEALPPEQAIAYLKELLRGMLDNPGGKPYNPTFAPDKDTLNVWLITGVNGAGKTTTIGKLAHIAQKSGYKCLIGAADTFRAAAVQQVKVWGDRSNVEVIANPGKNTDPAAVVFDAITAAQSRQTELLLIDTAGRLQNKKNLMDELSKIRRIIDKKAPNAQVESLLVLDATLGQNGLRQAEVFSEAAQLSGVVLTKLDGTAKGGIALAVVQQLGLPIRFIGAGEGIEDLRPFSSYEFVEALLSG